MNPTPNRQQGGRKDNEMVAPEGAPERDRLAEVSMPSTADEPARRREIGYNGGNQRNARACCNTSGAATKEVSSMSQTQNTHMPFRFRWAVSCEYLIDGDWGAVTHLNDEDGRALDFDFDRAERFAFVQETDPRCVEALVVMTDGVPA